MWRTVLTPGDPNRATEHQDWANAAYHPLVVHSFTKFPVDNRTWLWIKPGGRHRCREPRVNSGCAETTGAGTLTG
ncbi:hypothetical protein B9S64_16605 [Streptomyces sp. SM18]|nr:hypothetical protein B9S64_16605 [Streptomyces sp. SM18]